MEEEEEKGDGRKGDGEDSVALAGGGGGQKRTHGQSENWGCAGSQKTDCGRKLPHSKAHKRDQRPEADHGIKGARKGSDIETRGAAGLVGELSELRVSRGRWTRDSPGSVALSPPYFVELFKISTSPTGKSFICDQTNEYGSKIFDPLI